MPNLKRLKFMKPFEQEFNNKSSSKKMEQDETKKNLVNFHLEIAKKIDNLIAEHEKETSIEESDSVQKEEIESSLASIVEIREPLKKRITISNFKTDIRTEVISNYLNFENKLLRVELSDRTDPGFKFVRNLEEPKDFVYIKNIEPNTTKDDDFHSKMLGGLDKSDEKTLMGFAHIKIRKKDEVKKLKTEKNKSKQTSPPKKMNGFTMVKKELEETKKEIEEKKKELELAEKKAKEEKEELKIKKKEKLEKEKEAEKRKKLEIKKAAMEAREKEKEQRKKAKVEERKKKLEAKIALKEESLRKKALKSKKKKIAKPEKEPVDLLKSKKKKEKTKASPLGFHHFILGKKEAKEENPILDEDIIQVLKIADELLEKLPEEVIDEFVNSENFALYEKVINKYKIK